MDVIGSEIYATCSQSSAGLRDGIRATGIRNRLKLTYDYSVITWI